MHRSRLRGSWLLALLIFLLLLPAPLIVRASAGSAAYDQGRTDYHAGRITQAVAEFELAINDRYQHADVYYLLGLSFSKLKRWSDALWAYDTVLRRDPGYGASHATLARKQAQARANGGTDNGPPAAVTASTTNGSSSGNGPGTPDAAAIAATLSSSAVYVAPAMQSAVGNSSALQTTASQLQQQSSTMARFAFVGGPPAPYPSLGAYAYALFTRLSLSQALLIVVSPHGVAARTDRLSDSDTQQLVRASTPEFLQGSYIQGADSLARAIVRKADDQAGSASRTRNLIIAAILLIVLALLAVFVGVRASRWNRAYRDAVAWRDALTGTLTSTESHVEYLPLEHPAHQIFLTASAYYGTASKILDGLKDVGALQAAFRAGAPMNALGQARAGLQAAERALVESEAKAGGTATNGNQPQPDAAQAVPGGEITPAAEFRDRPSATPARAACFFCARPLDPATAQVVEVSTGTGTRRVMACDEHAADVRAGRQPRVLAVPDPRRDGQPAPWWGVPSYNPYRDWAYDPYYYRSGLGWGSPILWQPYYYPANNFVFIDGDGSGWAGDSDDRGGYDQAASAGFDSSRPDSASFDAAGRDMPSAAEADFGTGGGFGTGNDRS